MKNIYKIETFNDGRHNIELIPIIYYFDEEEIYTHKYITYIFNKAKNMDNDNKIKKLLCKNIYMIYMKKFTKNLDTKNIIIMDFIKISS